MIKQNDIKVTKTARYFTIGELTEQTEEIWFVCHGYGQLASYFIKHFQILDDGKTFIVAPEGLSRFYLGEYTGRIGATWMTKEDRENDINDYVNYLDAVFKPILETAKNARVNYLGFSQGATTICRYAAISKPRIDNLIMWAGSLPHDVSPQTAKEVFGETPTYIIYGDEDEYLAHINIPEYEKKLKAIGFNYELIEFKGKHEMNKEVLLELKEKTAKLISKIIETRSQ